MAQVQYYGTGRRKSSVARVRLIPGEGRIIINDRQIDDYIPFAALREVVRQNEFNNLKFDHGAYINKILFNDNLIEKFDIDCEDYLLIKKAIYFHNKKDLSDNLSERERFFSKLLRDADRIDIYRTLSERKEKKNVFDDVSSYTILNSFYQGNSINIKDLKTKGDRVILRLGFVKLFSFPESREVLEKLGYLNDYISSIEVNNDKKELFENILKEINAKGDKKYVR